MRPLLTVEAPMPEPMNEAIVATAGSARTIRATRCCNCFMAMKEISWAASVVPKMMPVSCCGKKPLGTAR